MGVWGGGIHVYSIWTLILYGYKIVSISNFIIVYDEVPNCTQGKKVHFYLG
jgi:hypothetical protein